MPKLEASVIIPLSPTEKAWEGLCDHLTLLPASCEVIFVRPSPALPAEQARLDSLASHLAVAWVVAPAGRAVQMNYGARTAKKPYLWFVHADSRFALPAVEALAQSIASAPRAVHYFDLGYLSDGPWLSRLNAWGAQVRSHALGMPFGDQGLCLARALFMELGGFPEGAAYGEDHLLVWRARQAGLTLRCTGATIYSSARKYARGGWVATTLSHAYLTWKQALPQWLAWQRARWRR